MSYWFSIFKDHIIWVMDLGYLNCFFLSYPRVEDEHEIQICQMLIDLSLKIQSGLKNYF